MVWTPSFREQEILVIEITTGFLCSTEEEPRKLRITYEYLMSHWKKWLRDITSTGPPKNLWFRGLAVSYAGRFLFEQPIHLWEERKRLH